MRPIVDTAIVRSAGALILGGLLCLAVIGGEVRSAEPGFTAEDVEFFEKRVRPVLVQRCYECHSQQTGKQRGGLTLDDRDAILSGGDSGPAVVPREVDKSLLVEAVRIVPTASKCRRRANCRRLRSICSSSGSPVVCPIRRRPKLTPLAKGSISPQVDATGPFNRWLSNPYQRLQPPRATFSGSITSSKPNAASTD